MTRERKKKRAQDVTCSCCICSNYTCGPSLTCVGLHWPSLAVAGRRWLPWACVGLRWQMWAFVGLRWPSVAVVGCYGPLLSIKWKKKFEKKHTYGPNNARRVVWALFVFVGLCWPSLAFVGRHWLPWAFVSRSNKNKI